MTTYNTLGSLIDGRFTVTAHCHADGCRHSAPLDLVVLAERLRPDFVTIGDPNPLVPCCAAPSVVAKTSA